jgi:hypothetical protein
MLFISYLVEIRQYTEKLLSVDRRINPFRNKWGTITRERSACKYPGPIADYEGLSGLKPSYRTARSLKLVEIVLVFNFIGLLPNGT